MNTFFIKPTDPASRPRDPETGARLAAEGEEKPMNTYWLRRQLAGEVDVLKDESLARKQGIRTKEKA